MQMRYDHMLKARSFILAQRVTAIRRRAQISDSSALQFIPASELTIAKLGFFICSGISATKTLSQVDIRRGVADRASECPLLETEETPMLSNIQCKAAALLLAGMAKSP